MVVLDQGVIIALAVAGVVIVVIIVIIIVRRHVASFFALRSIVCSGCLDLLFVSQV